MDRIIAVGAVIAFLVAWTFFLYRQSGGRLWSPLRMALSSTAAAILFLVSGSLGYTLSTHERLVAGTAWTGEVIWPQIAAGIAAAVVAAFLWRKGIRSIRSETRAVAA